MKKSAALLPLLALICCLSTSMASLRAQSTATDTSDPNFASFVFDVVSIRTESKSSALAPMSMETPDGYRQRGTSIQRLIYLAYHTGKYTRLQMGAPWISLDLYQVEAKMSPEIAEAFAKLSPNDQKIARQHMYRQLLKDYLKISVHLESQEVPALELRVGKNEPHLKEITDATVPDQGLIIYGQTDSSMICKGLATPLASLVLQMQGRLGKPIFDKTGLAGRYEFSFRFAQGWIPMAAASSADPAAAPPNDAPDYLAAVKDQLGLILVPTKGMVDVVVIDHIERPATN